MTRINVVPVEELEDLHLLAEYRELPRIFKLAKSFHLRAKPEKFPKDYILGKGHVIFFYNKLLWLFHRQEKIIQELQKRGFNLKFISPKELLNGCPPEYLNDYIVTEDALSLNRERIAIRLQEYKEKIKSD